MTSATEIRAFPSEIKANAPDDLVVHLVTGNHATHKTRLIRNWLARRPRWHVCLTPASASWLNQAARFFAFITERNIRRGIHESVAARKADNAAFINARNAKPRPFSWINSADQSLASIARFCPRTPVHETTN
ncbi:MAG: hypothetical protein ACKOED_01625 [Aestuariivirga sp.]|uniref:hypothetical protein n=1 Tax=Aestuariivirga sp. TaxID=2650926 RepID=UPI0038CFD6BC